MKQDDLKQEQLKEDQFKPDQRQRTLLVVEDDLDFARMLMTSLRLQFGYRVLYAARGVEVAGMAWKEQPDLIVMDLAMPGMNGLVTTSMLKRNAYTAHIPVVAFSNYGRVSTWKQGALDAGCALCLDKSVRLEELHEAIARLLDLN